MSGIQADVIVIGAGIAGLSAAVACHRQGLKVAVLDRGSPVIHRNRANPNDIASGVGGAGLFSDGKFSFFPSASGLWTLEPRSDLLLAYDWFSEIARRNAVEPPPFPEIALLNHAVHNRSVALSSAESLARIIQLGPVSNHICKLIESLNAGAV